MINDPRAGRIRNRLNAIDSVKPNYDVKKNRRELDVLCYTEGKVILHGHYDYNYSFCYIEADITGNTDLSDLINKIFFGEWEQYYSYIAADEHSAYRLKYFLNEGKITQYSSSIIYEPLGTLVNDESVGKVIDKAIKDVYAEKDGYDEDQVRAKLIEMKKKIAESEDLLFEKKVLPIERELSRMQHLVFGSMQIRKLYIECRALTASKYNAYMTLVR
jgi:hypothetical protein